MASPIWLITSGGVKIAAKININTITNDCKDAQETILANNRTIESLNSQIKDITTQYNSYKTTHPAECPTIPKCPVVPQCPTCPTVPTCPIVPECPTVPKCPVVPQCPTCDCLDVKTDHISSINRHKVSI